MRVSQLAHCCGRCVLVWCGNFSGLSRRQDQQELSAVDACCLFWPDRLLGYDINHTEIVLQLSREHGRSLGGRYVLECRLAAGQDNTFGCVTETTEKLWQTQHCKLCELKCQLFGGTG
jgi:hypothetical protein